MKKFMVIAAALACLTMACEPKPDSLALLDQLVVSTSYDTNAKFGLYETYAIPTDTIGFYSNTTSGTGYIVQSPAYDYPRPIINAIKKNMNDRHFQNVGRKENPDLAINVSIVHDYNVYQHVIYGGYGYGAGYYGYGGYE